jgi:hypothetical protein
LPPPMKTSKSVAKGVVLVMGCLSKGGNLKRYLNKDKGQKGCWMCGAHK